MYIYLWNIYIHLLSKNIPKRKKTSKYIKMEGSWEGNKWLASASLFYCWLGLLSRLNAYTKIRWLSGGFAQPMWSRQWNRPILISFHDIYVNRRTIHPGSSHIGTVVCRSLLSRPVCWYTACKMGLNFSSGRGICHLPQEARVYQHHTGWAGKPWLLWSRCFSVDEIILPKQVLEKKNSRPHSWLPNCSTSLPWPKS